MRKILKIAKLELSILTFSPVIWLVLPIFCVLCGMTVMGTLSGYKTSLDLHGDFGGFITRNIYGLPGGFFVDIQQTLYLYLPILTMGIMSRETSSGSIKLLLSSPVKLSEIILGKYVAMVVLCLAFISVIAIFALAGGISIDHPDTGLLISGIFGLFLLICTYAAIGLFMSCLTSYQIVAAIATLAVFAALRYVGSVGQSMDVVRDLTSFLSISGRTNTMIAGLISTKDVFYYILIIFLFLALSMLYLKNQRELKTWKQKVSRYILLVCCVLIVGYITCIPALIGYWDLSSGKQMTITPASQQIAKKVKGKLKISSYVNLLAPNPSGLLPEFRNADLDYQSMFKRFIPGIENEYVYYYHEVVDTTQSIAKWNPNFKGITDINKLADQVAAVSGFDRKIFIGPDQIDKQVDLKPEGYLQVRRLEYNGKSTFLRFYSNDELGSYAQEREFMAAVKRLTEGVPSILFLTGNNERTIADKNDQGYQGILADKSNRRAMINQGFDVDTINLDKQDMPAQVDLLVIADPTVTLSGTVLAKLSKYIQAGGDLLITTEPGRQAVINPLLSVLGVQVKQGMLVNPKRNFTQDQIEASYAPGSKNIDQNVLMLQNAKKNVELNSASALSFSTSGPFEIQPLLVSPSEGWNKVLPVDINAPLLTFNPVQGDQKGVFPVSATLKRNVNGKEQRIIVSAEADYLSNSKYANLSGPIKFEKYLSVDLLFRWLSNGKFPFDDSRPDPKDKNMGISKEQLSAMTVFLKFILPAIVILIGIIVLFKRRNN